MADLDTPKTLDKLFVIVSEALHNSFVEKYLTPVGNASRDTSYDGKIVFLEKTSEIFTHGKLFGLNNASDVEALVTIVNGLSDLIGDIPEDATSTTIVDYIKECIKAELVIATNEEIDNLFNS